MKFDLCDARIIYWYDMDMVAMLLLIYDVFTCYANVFTTKRITYLYVTLDCLMCDAWINHRKTDSMNLHEDGGSASSDLTYLRVTQMYLLRNASRICVWRLIVYCMTHELITAGQAFIVIFFFLNLFFTYLHVTQICF